MQVLIWRNKIDEKIVKIESLDRYFKIGKSIQEICDAVVRYNWDTEAKESVELHQVPMVDEEIMSYVATDGTLLFAENIVHPCTEEIPKNTYIYVFRKHKGHIIPSINVMKVFQDGVLLPELKDPDGVLPIAWCKARELIGLLGISVKDILSLEKEAKAKAWGWYKEESMIPE